MLEKKYLGENDEDGEGRLGLHPSQSGRGAGAMFMAPSPPNVPRESIPLSRVLASSRYPDNLQIDRWMKRWMDEWLILAFHPWKWVGGWIFTFHQYIHLWNKSMDGWMDDSTFSHIGLPAQFWVFDQDCESVAEMGEWVRGSLDYFASVITESIQKGGVSAIDTVPKPWRKLMFASFTFLGGKPTTLWHSFQSLDLAMCV